MITGEGRIDSQTIHGKVPVGVAKVAKRFNKPVIGIAGSLTADVGVMHDHGIDAVFSVIYTICSLEDALEKCQRERQDSRKKYRGGTETRAGDVSPTPSGRGVRCRPGKRRATGHCTQFPAPSSLPRHVIHLIQQLKELGFQFRFWCPCA